MADAIELNTEVNLFGEEISDVPNIDRDMLTQSLYVHLKDITLEEFVSYFTNSFEAVVDYANLVAGEKTGQRISLLFNPHRLDTGTERFPVSLYQALKKHSFIRGLARVVLLNKKRGITKDLLYQSIGIGVEGTSYLQEFPPHVARDLALEYNLSKNSRVLDPCAGWGGRMLGFSVVVDRYTCCEPSERTAAGLRQLLTFIQSFRSDFSAAIHETPFEDVQLQRNTYDFALTSPPYYDTERYAPGETTNSFVRYGSFDAWCKGFYAPLIHRTMAALKPGACFVLNIGSRLYPLNDRLMQIAEGKYAVEKQRGKLSASNGLGKLGEGETFYEVRRTSDADVVLLDETAITLDSFPNAVKILTAETSARVQSDEHPTALRRSVSALDFVLRQADASQRASETTAAPQTAAATAELTSVSHTETAADVAAQLLARGHRLFLTFDGRFFVSDAPRLLDTDRPRIAQHRDALIALAERLPPPAEPIVSVVAPTFFAEPRPSQSLADFLGAEPPRIVANWTQDDPPSLDGINEVVVNFATNGLDWIHGHKPVGVTVSTLDGQLTRFLPFAFTGGGNLNEETIKRWAQTELRGKKIYNSNTRFDIHMARVWGVDLIEQGCTFSDVQHTAALLDDHRKRFNIDTLAEDYLPELAVVPRVDETRHHEYHPSEVAEREYFTARVVGQLLAVMRPQIDAEELTKVQDLEDRVLPAVVEMEKNGAPIDVALLEQYATECNRRHDQLLYEVAADVGFSFDHKPSSWQRLFEHLGLPPQESYAEGVISTIDHPLIRKAYHASQLASLNSKIFKAYKEKVGSDGILHFELNQLRNEDKGTVSGRFSAGFIQQVPNHDNHSRVFGDDFFPRRLYIPGKGARYLAADAAQIQYRIFAHYANNPQIMQMYADNPQASFHRMIEALIRPYKEDLVYSHVKSMNFMRIFGGGLVKLAVMMGFITEDVGEEIRQAKSQATDARLAQAREIDAIYDRELPEVRPLLRQASHLAATKCNEFCRRHDMLHQQFIHRGYVRTVLGRRSRFPDNYRLHKAFCMIDQGSEGDIVKTKIAELFEARKETGFVMRMTVHDEVTGDALADHTLDTVSEILNRQSFPQLRVPILWECKEGETWADCK